MDINYAYDLWSSTYDADKNLTRDLDQLRTKQALSSRQFGSVLELGCGTGKNTQFLSEIAGVVNALDFSEGMLQLARGKVNAKNVDFVFADMAQKWPSKSDWHDLIVCNLVLEHLEDLSHVFQEAFRCLRIGGSFYISELHPFRQYLGGRARFHRGEEVTEVPSYVHHVSEFLQAAAFSGLNLESLNEYWHSEDQHKPPRLLVFEFKKG